MSKKILKVIDLAADRLKLQLDEIKRLSKVVTRAQHFSLEFRYTIIDKSGEIHEGEINVHEGSPK